jgi:ABC-type transport system involved in multi-copper enzyme maturation permease subunit
VLLVGLILILTLQINGKVNRLEELEAELAVAAPLEELTPFEAMTLEGNRIEAGWLRDSLLYPAFIGYASRLAAAVGWFFVILFAAVSGGEDFTRRTLRVILAQGVGRSQFILGRVLSLWLATGLAVVIVVVLAAIRGLFLHARMTDDPVSLQGMGEVLLVALRTWLTFLPFIVATLFWAVLGRNAGPAMGLGIGLHTFEVLMALFVQPMGILFLERGVELPFFIDWPAKLLSVSLGYNADVFLHWGPPGLASQAMAEALATTGQPSVLPTDPWRGAAFLAGYTLLFLGLTIWIMNRRDVTYAE